MQWQYKLDKNLDLTFEETITFVFFNDCQDMLQTVD